jgi:dienelactone hydrolase
MVDSGRPGVYADGSFSEHREFMTQIWYPANRGVDGPKSTYTDEATAEYLLKGTNLDENIRFQIKTHGVVGAQVADGGERFPVVIFSPGLGLSYFLYQSILEDLASHGYIVVAVNSPNSAVTSFPDGHLRTVADMETDAEGNKYNQEVTDDLTFVAKQLQELDNNLYLPLTARIAFNRIGCFGHSFGGAASIQAGIQSPQVASSIDLEGSAWGEAYKKPISKPMMIVSSAFHPEGDKTLDITWKNLPKGSYKVGVNDTAHSSFSDYILITRSMGTYQPGENDNPNPMDATQAIQITRDLVRTFFDTNLKHADRSKINKISKKYQEVKIEEK